MHVSERRACAALGQHRSTQRKVPRGRPDEERLTADLTLDKLILQEAARGNF